VSPICIANYIYFGIIENPHFWLNRQIIFSLAEVHISALLPEEDPVKRENEGIKRKMSK
jgi:hypothetical protein